MITTNAIGCRLTFLQEKRSKAYNLYAEVSIAMKNFNMRQDFLQSSELCSEAGRKGA